MLVMPLVADVRADVVKKRTELQPLALARTEVVLVLRGVEQGQRELRHLVRMVSQVTAPLTELDDAAAPHVRVSAGRANVAAVPAHVIENQTLAQRKVAEGDFVRTESIEKRFEKNRPDGREVCSPWIQSGQAKPLLERKRDKAFAQPPQVVRAHQQSAHVVRHGGGAARGNHPQRQDGP